MNLLIQSTFTSFLNQQGLSNTKLDVKGDKLTLLTVDGHVIIAFDQLRLGYTPATTKVALTALKNIAGKYIIDNLDAIKKIQGNMAYIEEKRRTLKQAYKERTKNDKHYEDIRNYKCSDVDVSLCGSTNRIVVFFNKNDGQLTAENVAVSVDKRVMAHFTGMCSDTYELNKLTDKLNKLRAKLSPKTYG